MLKDTNVDPNRHISPSLSEQAQEAISCMYSLMSRFSGSLLEDDGRQAVLGAAHALQMAIQVIVSPLLAETG